MTERSASSSRTKVMTILGTRPEIIRLSRVIAQLEDSVDHVLLHTGQNYDYELSEVFFDGLGLRKPDVFLDVDTTSLGRALGGIIIASEPVLARERPDAVLVLGDTNSCIAALMAKRMRIPVFHMEAGNRCFDENVPEEINRRLIDHIADFNLVYTEHARRNLLAEGIHPRRIYLTGSPLREVLDHFRPQVDASDVLARLELEAGQYFAVSMHREENVDNSRHLTQLLAALTRIRSDYQLPIIVSTHPRTASRIASLGRAIDDPGIRFLKPLAYFDYVHLQENARCTISDSGTISEEAAILNFPAVTIRNAIERPEAMDAGSIMMAGLDPGGILETIAAVIRQHGAGVRPEPPGDYLISNTSQRVVNLILGTARLSHGWSNLAPEEPHWLRALSTSASASRTPEDAEGGGFPEVDPLA